jgi:flagellin-specific chaperone FliS
MLTNLLPQKIKKNRLMRHIAERKRGENIVEYLLFLWQMEDLLRGVAFDLNALNNGVLAEIDDEKLKAESHQWFVELGKEMQSNKAETSGHTTETYDILAELSVLQHTLLTVLDDAPFKRLFNQVQPLLIEFRSKGDKLPKGDVETALTAMYGYLTLRLSGQAVSEATQEALDVISAYLRHLAKAYRDMKRGILPMNN